MNKPFDASFQAQATIKERSVWVLYLGITFFLLYGSANQLAFMTAPHNTLVMDWEKNIPFIEIFIIPYMSSDILFVLALLLSQTRLQLRVLGLRLFFTTVISVCFFVLFPFEFTFDKPQSSNFLFEILKLDQPYNQMPSMHVSLAIVLWYSMKDHISNKLLKFSLFIWYILIALSTLFVYQHHFIDIPTGAAVGFLVVYLISDKKRNYLNTRFMTPRSLKIALYYLVGTILTNVLAFNLESYFFTYLFLSLFLMSAIYAFGFNDLLVRNNRKANIFQLIIFAPYFIYSHIQWKYYTKKVDFMAQLNENIYFGRQATKEEYKELKSLGITKIINLASDQQFHKTDIEEIKFSLLDITMQDPKHLNEIVETIHSLKDEKIYIHCTLGMSRSILALSSYLLHNNHSIDEINKIMNELRPIYVKSKYMSINLDLYREYISNKPV